MHTIANYIDGEHRLPIGEAWLDNFEPATGAVYGRIPDSDGDDVDAAVAAARRAFPEWAALGAAGRSEHMLRVADLVERNLDALARAESVDNGKPLGLARAMDIPRAAANFRFFATRVLHGANEAYELPGTLSYTRREPMGAVACISPWNLPLYLFTWKIAPALAAGNTVVAKPSEMTPMTAYLLTEMCMDAGLPRGVFNVVQGLGAKAGAALVEHPDIAAVSFTGGTATGRLIALAAAHRFRKVSLELGGKNPNLVFADADLDRALDESVRAAFANQGQICLCGSRLLVHRSIHDEFVAGLVEKARGMRVGDPLEAGTAQGALVSAAHRDKVLRCIELAREEGGTVLCGGGPPEPSTLPERCRNGYFVAPTVITGLDAACRTNQEEIFGPVVSVIPFDDEAEAIAIANGTPYGLSASVWTQDVGRAHRVAHALHAGTVWINCWLVRDLRVPFGGVKQSGVGREGGDEALRFFTEAKTVSVHLEPAGQPGSERKP